MKMLVCTSEYFPHGSGIANAAYNIVKQLKTHGIECTVCSPTGPDITLGSKKLIDRFGFLGLVYYWYLVYRFFKENDYDAVWLLNPYFICRNPFPLCLVTMQSTYYGMSLYRVGNTRFLRIYYKITAKIEEYSLAKFNKKTLFTGAGLPVCEELEMMRIEKERIAYIPNGADIQPFKPVHNKIALRTKFGIPEEDTIILSVGRLTPQKRSQKMVEVFSSLEKKVDNLTLVIAGNGELLDTVKEFVTKNEIKKVIFLGHVNHLNLPELYACSDYYIITSIYEGGMPPLTLSEAMASGLPCIVSDIPNFRAVKDAHCGIIVNFEDTNLAANEILDYLLRDNSDHAKNAREYAIKFLDWKIISKEYQKLFHRINYIK